MKCKNGFTLVEVIVVALIVLILSAIAIPMYSNYVRDARQTSVDNLAETAAAAANGYWRRTGANDSEMKSISIKDDLKVYYDEDKYNVEIKSGSVEVTDKQHTDINASRPFK